MSDDAVLEQLRRAYEFETDEELKRKREVVLSMIVKHTKEKIVKKSEDVDFNAKRYEVLSGIVRDRVKAKRRWERIREVIGYVGIVGPFLIGIVSAEPIKRAVFGSEEKTCAGVAPVSSSMVYVVPFSLPHANRNMVTPSWPGYGPAKW